MITTSMSRIVVLLTGLVAAGGIATTVALQHVRREPVPDTAASTAPALTKPTADEGAKGPAPLATAKTEADAVIAALSGATAAPDSSDGVPSFDIARIEPNGETVVAGRAAPGATVELLRNGEPHDRAVADQSGQFVMVPSPLPPGTYDLTLRARQPDGKLITSKQSVTVALEPNRNDRPVVALMTPDKPTVVLSQPAPSKTEAAGPVVVEAVEIDAGGKFHVSGRARPGAATRLYLNDSFIASATAAADGRFAVTINEGIGRGNYRVRLDEIDLKTGAVRGRAEVPFNASDPVVTASTPARSPQSTRPDSGAQPQVADATATAVPDAAKPSAVVVPKVTTTTVSRGDSLWRISQLTYGAGTRYATIYKANREQIRNPNLIYPGQVFLIPSQEAHP